MPFVYRDADGNVQAVYEQPVQGTEEVAADDAGLIAFLQRSAPGAMLPDQWMQSDIALARVLEDLIELLIEKKILLFTDFPRGAQQKLLERRGLRKEFSYVDQLFGEDDENYGEGGSDFL